MYYLHVKPLDGREWRAPIGQGALSVGRDPENDLVLDEYGVSSRHARIELQGDRTKDVRPLLQALLRSLEQS